MYILITPATSQPVTVEEVKSNLGIFHSEKDTIISLYIASAVDYSERATGRQFMPAVWELQLGSLYDGFVIKKSPFVSIVHIKYYDQDNVLQTMNSSDYFVCGSNPVTIGFKNDPLYLYDRPDALQIRFNAGYEDADAVPALIKDAIILIASNRYNNPTDPVETLTKASTNLLRQYRVWQKE